VTAIVLAAGLSTRMGGRLKPLLPLGELTVIERIISTLAACPLEEIVVVVGHQRQAIEQHLAGWDVRTVFNTDYATGEMLSSVQVGLRSVSAGSNAALIVLGDQPALESSVVAAVIAAYRDGLGSVIVPSFQMRRGHPLLIGRVWWQTILGLEGKTLRDFMRGLGAEICHVPVNTPSIFQDMDTPAEYLRELAEYSSRRQNAPAIAV
jgi:molybdenum cofactor cytidylyltransferase